MIFLVSWLCRVKQMDSVINGQTYRLNWVKISIANYRPFSQIFRRTRRGDRLFFYVRLSPLLPFVMSLEFSIDFQILALPLVELSRALLCPSGCLLAFFLRQEAIMSRSLRPSCSSTLSYAISISSSALSSSFFWISLVRFSLTRQNFETSSFCAARMVVIFLCTARTASDLASTDCYWVGWDWKESTRRSCESFLVLVACLPFDARAELFLELSEISLIELSILQKNQRPDHYASSIMFLLGQVKPRGEFDNFPLSFTTKRVSFRFHQFAIPFCR